MNLGGTDHEDLMRRFADLERHVRFERPARIIVGGRVDEIRPGNTG